MPGGELENVLHRGRLARGRRRQLGRRTREPLHDGRGGVHDERPGVHVTLVADRVRRASAQGHDIPGPRDEPTDGAVGFPDVEGELTGGDAVDLRRSVPVHDRWAAAGGHPHLDGEDLAAGLVPGGEDGVVVGAERELLGLVEVDR